MGKLSITLLFVLVMGFVGASAAMAEPPVPIDLDSLIESVGDDDHVVGEEMC